MKLLLVARIIHCYVKGSIFITELLVQTLACFCDLGVKQHDVCDPGFTERHWWRLSEARWAFWT